MCDASETVTWQFPVGAKVRYLPQYRPAPHWATVPWRITGRTCRDVPPLAPVELYSLTLWERTPGWHLGTHLGTVYAHTLTLWTDEETQTP